MCPPRQQHRAQRHPHAFGESSPWTWIPSHPAGSGCRKGTGNTSANILKNSSAISTPATSFSFCESGLERYLVLIKPHLFTVKHSKPLGLMLGLQSLFVYWKAAKNYPIRLPVHPSLFIFTQLPCIKLNYPNIKINGFC